MASLITVVALETEGYNSDGTTFTETVYLSSHPYTPEAGPPPEGGGSIEPLFNPRILTDPLKSFAMGCEAFKSRPVQAIGDLEIDNSNNSMGFLLTRKAKGFEANYYLGYDDQDFDTFQNIGALIQDEFIQSAEDRIKLPFVDRLAVLNDPVPMELYPETTTNVGIWNTPVPELWGKIKTGRLVPYDKANEIYVYSSHDAGTGFDDVRDQGVNIPVGTPPTPSTYQFITTAEGYYAIQFVSNTVGPITFSARSLNSPGYDIIFNQIAAKYSLTIDSASMAVFDTANNRNVGVYITEPTPGADILNGVLKAVNGWYWQGNNGEIKVGQLAEPVGSPKIFVSDVNGIGQFLKISDKGPGVTGSLGYQKNWFVHEDNQLAASVVDPNRSRLMQDFRYLISDTGADINLDDFYASAADRCPLPTTISNTNQAVACLKNQVALYGSRRWFYRFGAIIDAQVVAELEPGDIVALHEEDFGLVDPYDIDIHGRPLAYNTWLMHSGTRLVATVGDNGTATNALENLSTLQFVGNNWYTFYYPYTITADTVLEFDFMANTDSKSSPQVSEGELLGIGVSSTALPASTATENNRWFQIHGTQTYAIQDYNNQYVNNSGWRRYKIPIGQHFTGFFGYLRLVADFDAYNVFSNVQDTRFRNVRLREDGYLHTLLLAGEFNLGANEVALTTWGA